MASGKAIKTYLRFCETKPIPSQKTKRWRVTHATQGFDFGTVRWYSHWRRYCFFPVRSIVIENTFDANCLHQIADFLESETAKHRENNNGKARKTTQDSVS